MDSEMQVNWSELPSLPLEKVYSFLDHDNQVNMSLVCRSWSTGFGSPSVWNTFEFSVGHSHPLPVMKFVRKYGRMFRHVCISRSGFSRDILEKFSSRLVDFLEILSRNTQLFTVEFDFLSVEKADDYTYNDIYAAIASFLSSQHTLRRVQFRSCRFRYQDSVKLLRNLSENNRMSLAHLYFRKFNRDNESNLNADQNPPSIADFPNLKTLDTDYSLIFEKMVKQQPDAIKNVLSPLKLKLDIERPLETMTDIQGLSSSDWLTMKTLYPYLEIELDLIIFDSDLHAIEFIITKHMQISRLFLVGIKEAEIPELIRHLLECRTNEHLVSFEIEWNFPIQLLFSTMCQFLLDCNRLKFFKLTLINPTSGIDVLLESWVTNRPQSLSSVIIDVQFEEEDEYDLKSKEKIPEYIHILNSVGLNITVVF